jgi:hypothetical protein
MFFTVSNQSAPISDQSNPISATTYIGVRISGMSAAGSRAPRAGCPIGKGGKYAAEQLDTTGKIETGDESSDRVAWASHGGVTKGDTSLTPIRSGI